MSDIAPQFSPDGQWFWTGGEWCPAPPTAPANTEPVLAAEAKPAAEDLAGQQAVDGIGAHAPHRHRAVTTVGSLGGRTGWLGNVVLASLLVAALVAGGFLVQHLNSGGPSPFVAHLITLVRRDCASTVDWTREPLRLTTESGAAPTSGQFDSLSKGGEALLAPHGKARNALGGQWGAFIVVKSSTTQSASRSYLTISCYGQAQSSPQAAGQNAHASHEYTKQDVDHATSTGRSSLALTYDVPSDDPPSGCSPPDKVRGQPEQVICQQASKTITSLQVSHVARVACARRPYADLPWYLWRSQARLSYYVLGPVENISYSTGSASDLPSISIGRVLGAKASDPYLTVNCIGAPSATSKSYLRSEIAGVAAGYKPSSSETARPVPLTQSHLSTQGCNADYHDRLTQDVISQGLYLGWSRASREIATSCAYGQKGLLDRLFSHSPTRLNFDGCHDTPPDPNGIWGEAPLWECDFSKSNGGKPYLDISGGCGASVGCAANAVRFTS